MKTTQKKHWQNGYQVRGGWYKTIALSLFNYAIMFSWGELPNGERREKITMEIFKLI